jgi:PiT family inorganic phosphate transporter
VLFKEPKKNAPPPVLIRSLLILTCSGVSLSHGSNDGQKGVGLIMLILIGIVPSYFALNSKFVPTELAGPLKKIEVVLNSIDSVPLSQPDREKLRATLTMNRELIEKMSTKATVGAIAKNERFLVRKDIMLIDRNIKTLMSKEEVRISQSEAAVIKKEIKTVKGITDYSPTWVILMIAISLGIGTMVGWKRIVKTIGEKIGKEHLTYAQGASAELVAASTIAVSTYLALPVSTTHVLSSGIAGSMVASKGVKNLQSDTVRNIILAWFLTLPVVMLMAGTLFLLFRSLF